jgi:hypothetical protein
MAKGSKPSEGEVRDTAKTFQDKEKGGADSNKQFREAGHKARDDYQKSGNPFGPLSKRGK